MITKNQVVEAKALLDLANAREDVAHDTWIALTNDRSVVQETYRKLFNGYIAQEGL